MKQSSFTIQWIPQDDTLAECGAGGNTLRLLFHAATTKARVPVFPQPRFPMHPPDMKSLFVAASVGEIAVGEVAGDSFPGFALAAKAHSVELTEVQYGEDSPSVEKTKWFNSIGSDSPDQAVQIPLMPKIEMLTTKFAQPNPAGAGK